MSTEISENEYPRFVKHSEKSTKKVIAIAGLELILWCICDFVVKITVFRKQRNSIWNMLLEKQVINTEKLKRNFVEISSVTKVANTPPPQSEFSRQLLTIET